MATLAESSSKRVVGTTVLLHWCDRNGHVNSYLGFLVKR